MDTNLLQSFVEAWKTKQDVEARLDKLKARLAELEERLLDQFTEAGVQRITVGADTVYLQRMLWTNPKDGNREGAILALQTAGLGDLVQTKVDYNTNTFNAWVREQDKAGQPLPDPIQGAFSVAEVYHLRVWRGDGE